MKAPARGRRRFCPYNSRIRENDSRLLTALVAVGVALRLYQWAAEGTFWLDEISLARNILARSLRELIVYPLAFDQVAPAGFLAVEKLVVGMFGSSERAFWLFPLVAGIAAVFLFRRLAEKTLDGAAVPIALALFALSVSMIRYSAELKQYGLDAAAAIVLTLVAIELWTRDHRDRTLVLVGLSGFIIICFSHASVLVMAGLGAAFTIAAITNARARRVVLWMVPIWAAASVTGLLLAERSMTESTSAFMNDFWRGGFLPLPVKAGRSVTWLWERLVTVYEDPWTMRYPLAWIVAIVALVGVVVLWRRERTIAMFVAAPFVLTVVAAIAQRYPFRQRLIVFLVPSALLLFAAGAGWIADAVMRRNRAAGVAVAALAIVPAVWAVVDSGLPSRVDFYKPAFEKLRAERRPGDAVHVAFLAHSAVIYYGPRYGVQPSEARRGVCDRNDSRAYLRDLDHYRGQNRVWILTRSGPAFIVAQENMRRYLDVIAVRREFLSSPSGVVTPITLGLYDFSDPRRLAAASAETFPVVPMQDYPKPGCRDWSGEAFVGGSAR